VEKNFPDQAEWNEELKDKLQRREANQAKYSEFQERETSAKTFSMNLNLVKDIMEVLEDRFYAKKILSSIQDLLHEGPKNYSDVLALCSAIDSYIDDGEWVKQILESTIADCQHFSNVEQICDWTATKMSDKTIGVSLCKEFYQQWQQKFEQSEAPSVVDYTKLAGAVVTHLDDQTWAGKLLDTATNNANDTYEYAAISMVNVKSGLKDESNSPFEQAVQQVKLPYELIKFVNYLRLNNIDEAVRKQAYQSGKQQFSEVAEKISWIEGIIELFKDTQWATECYLEISDAALKANQQLRFENSQKFHTK